MSEHGHCHDCGGTDGHHYNDCIYDGTDGGYSSYSRGGGSGASSGKWWIGYIIALIVGYGINELLGVIIIVGLIFWLMVSWKDMCNYFDMSIWKKVKYIC